MESKVENKLMQNLFEFVGLPLKYVRFKTDKDIGSKKDLLILELIFSDQGVLKTMVLVLDNELTQGDYETLAEKLTR